MAVIEVENLRIDAGGRALLSIDRLRLAGPGSVAMIGPNGAGKSTLLSALSGLRRTGHSITLDGTALSAMTAAERARRIGFVPQHFVPHWDLAVRALVELGAGRVRGLPQDAIGEAIRDHELDDLGERRWSTLSGGERARALLAAVLVGDPDIIVADEPGAALDIAHRMALVDRLSAFGRSRLVVAALHDIDLALSRFDRVLVLDRGRLAFDGSCDDLVRSDLLEATFGVPFRRETIDDRLVARPEIGRGP